MELQRANGPHAGHMRDALTVKRSGRSSPAPVQMWQWRAQSWCRCGSDERSPGADVGGGGLGPVQGLKWEWARSVSALSRGAVRSKADHYLQLIERPQHHKQQHVRADKCSGHKVLGRLVHVDHRCLQRRIACQVLHCMSSVTLGNVATANLRAQVLRTAVGDARAIPSCDLQETMSCGYRYEEMPCPGIRAGWAV
jgi:hypothetical protein